jgi:ketosteroid isomerase-like protein
MTTATSATESVAKELVELCKAGKNREALDRLYAPDIVSVEPMDFQGMPARMTGITAVRKKNEWWDDHVEVNRHEVDGPYVNGEQFAVRYRLDTTNKQTGQRRQDSEIAVYTVRDGKIAEERFFGTPGT